MEGKFELKALNTVGNLSLPRQTLPRDVIKLFNNSDELCIEAYVDASPSILIGQDNCNLTLTKETRVAESGSLAASRTCLGWVIHGPVDDNIPHYRDIESASSYAIDGTDALSEEVTGSEDEDLHNLVKRYFAIDLHGITCNRAASSAESRADRILRDTTIRAGEQWETGLLWKGDEKTVSESEHVALRRLKILEKKLYRDPEYARSCCSEMERLISKGYTEKLTNENSPGRRWYIPHFGRSRSDKTKIRLIFDAAAKTEGVSLNDQLLKGPDLLKSLIGVLMKFREKKVGIKGDIKDMFLRVKLRTEDRNAQCFFWRGMDRINPPVLYQMTTLIFGSKCSPSSAIFVKNTNAQEFRETFPSATNAIVDNTYVDDLLLSVDSEEQAIQMINDVTKINRAGGFEMHAWTSNSRSVMNLDNEQTDPQLVRFTTKTDELDTEKTLGLCWDTNKDNFNFNVELSKISKQLLTGSRKPTKREFLRIIMSVFDPLGFLAPYLIRSKILMQAVWVSGIGWDSELKDDEHTTWKMWLKDLPDIKLCSVPRCYLRSEQEVKEVQLHIFCDASPKAYAAVAYWRISLVDGSEVVSLVGSKSRVAPLKTLSVPRLELQGALLASRLGKLVTNEHNMHASKRFFWSDSRTVLLWVKSDPREYQTFVSHRLAEIADLSDSMEWRWVPSELNPADDATKPRLSPLYQNSRWFNGPEFLKLGEGSWPNQDCLKSTKDLDGTTTERKKRQFTLAIGSVRPNLPDPKRFSKFNRILRSTAWVLVAIDRWRRRKEPKMTVEHLDRAMTLLITEIQRDSFASEIAELKQQKPGGPRSRIRTLTPILDKDGIMRVRGRVNVPPELNFKEQPIIIDGGHAISRLILKEYHEKSNHSSDNTVVNEVRQRFWVVNLRKSLRTTSAKCQFCRLIRAKPTIPVMADLPPGRLAYSQRPFTHCGVDYFGPMLVKIGRRQEKRWGALFTCLTTRAVHLELAHSANIDSAIMALRRLIARRGQPKVVYSDNGRNFVGADRELQIAQKELDFQAQEEFVVNLGIKWVFIPPDAPHMGGAWERLIRSEKVSLKAVLREHAPREEVLVTLLAEAEHSVNSRPLTHVSMDPRDEEKPLFTGIVHGKRQLQSIRRS